MFKRMSDQHTFIPLMDIQPIVAEQLAKSWAYPFRDIVLPELCKMEADFARHYCTDNGRPQKLIPVMLTALIFKEMGDLTDQEIIEQLIFDRRFEAALEVENIKELYLCRKTLYNFRCLLFEDSHLRDLFDRIVALIISDLGLETDLQRTDSTHIFSNMAHLTRLELLVKVIENFVNYLKRHHPALYRELSEELRYRYGEGKKGYFADARSSEVKHRLSQAAEDLYRLIQFGGKYPQVHDDKSYSHLTRVFDEHCQTSEDEGELKITVKEAKDVPGDSLQNPSDEDAAYGRKGQGYEATLTETCNSDNPMQVINDIQLDGANHCDYHTPIPLVERLFDKNMKPETLFGDGGFVDSENIVELAKIDVKLFGPLTGSDKHPDKLKLADFEFSDIGNRVLRCPAGCSPLSQRSDKPGKGQRVYFDRKDCLACPMQSRCPVIIRSRSACLHFTYVALAGSLRRREQSTEEFKEQYRIRAGIEATNSELKRKHGLGRLKVRGYKMTEAVLRLKVTACNLKRYLKVKTEDLNDDIAPAIQSILHFLTNVESIITKCVIFA